MGENGKTPMANFYTAVRENQDLQHIGLTTFLSLYIYITPDLLLIIY